MIQVFGSSVGQEELDEIKSSFDNQWLGAGEKVSKFEKEFAKRCNFNNFVMTDNASNSLYLAIKLLNLKEGTEIILPSFTFVSCAQAIMENKCIPIFCDVDYDTQTVSLETIAPLITKNTGAILVVHYAGKCVDVKELNQLGIPIIEDCAHAVDSGYDGIHCGALGDIGVFSFDGMKNLSVGEGGGIVASSPSFIEKVRRLRYCGIATSGYDASKNKDKKRWWETEVLFHSLRHMPNDISASIGLAQLKKLDKLQEIRKNIWDSYQTELKNMSWLKTPVDPNPYYKEKHSYFTYFIRLVGSGIRDNLARYLLENGIYTTLRYYPIHMMNLFRTSQYLPITIHLNEQGLNLPLHPRITKNDLDKIIDTIKRFGKL